MRFYPRDKLRQFTERDGGLKVAILIVILVAPVSPTVAAESDRVLYSKFRQFAVFPPTFLSSSMAEHPAVNRRVVGSNPT
jgi:hypothetical protein